MNISVLGVGLIGGSMALKLKEKRFAKKVIGIDKNYNHLKEAKSLGIIDTYLPLEDAILCSDIVIIAIPVDSAKKVLNSVLDMSTKNQVIMDVGSTKDEIVKSVINHPSRSRYVATHPMWGTENSGPRSAQKDAFIGKSTVICNREESSEYAVRLVEKIYQILEMKLLYMDSADHDLHTAYISHISHITSYALANTVLEKEREEETIFQLASTGFSSTVRLAKSHPEMWMPIFKQNRENILDVLNEHISQLRKFKSALEKENHDFLEELIINANKIRGILR